MVTAATIPQGVTAVLSGNSSESGTESPNPPVTTTYAERDAGQCEICAELRELLKGYSNSPPTAWFLVYI
jgi:hypothetical protein